MKLSTRLFSLKEQDFPGLLLWSIVGFTVAALAWAALARLEVVISASGRLIPSAQLQTLSNLEGGTLKQIFVKPGQAVAKGQILLKLDPILRAADAASAQASVDALAVRAARLQGEARGRNAALDLPGVDAALLADERALARADAGALASDRAMAQARAEQARRTAAEADANLEQKRQALALAEQEVAVLQPLVARGAEPALSLTRALSNMSQARSLVAAAEQNLAKSQALVAESTRAVANVDDRFRNRAAEALATTRAELASRSGQQPALADRLDRTIVRAPMAGIISRLRVSTAGGAVGPGEPLVEMVPAGDRLLVEARVSPADIGFVRPGQAARVRITAYDYGVYGAMAGTVQSVAPDAVIDERTGEVHFLVRIALARPCFPTDAGPCLPLGPGMLAEVSLLGPKRSVLSYILSPLTRISASAFREK